MKKKKVVLVKIEERGTQQFYVPFGLIILAGALRKKGFEVDVVHEDYTDELYDNIKSRAEGSILVGFSTVTSPTLRYALECSQKLKADGHNIVWGGVHASLLPEVTMKEECIDFILRGEGEKSLPLLAKRLEQGSDVEDIQGVVYRMGTEVMISDLPPLVEKLDEYPPAFDFIDMNRYLFRLGNYERVVQIMASKGCPHRCTFCFNTAFNKSKIRYYGPELIQEQVRYMKEKYQIDGLLLNDDNYFAHRERAMHLLEEIDMPWATLARASMLRENFFTEKVLNKCISLVVGGESGSNSMLTKMKKAITASDIENAVLFCQKYRIPLRISFIFFFPLETDEERIETVRFIHKLSSQYEIDVALKTFNPYPGTVMYEEAISAGWKKPESILKWSSYFRSMKIENLNYLDPGRLKYWKKIFTVVNYGIYFNKAEFRNPFLKLLLKMYRPLINYRWRAMYVGFGMDIMLFNVYIFIKAVLRRRKLVR